MMKPIIYAIVILILISISCVDRNSSKYVLKKYNEIKEEKIEDFIGWRIFKRDDMLVFFMSYKEMDSSQYEYNIYGEVLPFRKYRTIGFQVNQEFDSLYRLGNENTYFFQTGLKILSSYSGKSVDDLDRVIKSNFRKYRKYDFWEIEGYSWDSACSFIIDSDLHLWRMKNAKSDKHFNHISGDWWYRIDVEE